jgi:hypothetical protein
MECVQPGKKDMTNSNIGQLRILQVLASNTAPNERPRQFQMREICDMTGLRDEKDVQRYLFILEGHKYVSPLPPGDFTSKVWQITAEGLKACRSVLRSMNAAA